MTLSGIEPATFWFVEQQLNHCVTAAPPPLEIYIEVVSIVKLYINIAHYVSYISYNLQLNHSNTEVHRNTNKPAQH